MATRAKTAPHHAVVTSIEFSEAGAKLVMCDVVQDETGASGWRTVRLYTEKGYAGRRLAELALRPEEFEEIGFNVVNRLLALTGTKTVADQHRRPTRRARKKQ
jgi:hypothetical protein